MVKEQASNGRRVKDADSFFQFVAMCLEFSETTSRSRNEHGHGFTKFILDSEMKRGRDYLGKIKLTMNDESRLKSGS